MSALDINRAVYFNKKCFTDFKWIMPFVNSGILNCKVAIAQMKNDLVLINKDGEIIIIIDNV